MVTAIDMTKGRADLPQAPLADEGTVDFVRTGPDTLTGRYLRQFWQPIIEARKVEAGRSIPLDDHEPEARPLSKPGRQGPLRRQSMRSSGAC